MIIYKGETDFTQTGKQISHKREEVLCEKRRKGLKQSTSNERKEASMRQLKPVFLLLICMGIISFLPNLVSAKVTGPCADCHSMHNSQNGEVVDATGPYRHLTKGDCIGCHTGINSGGGTSTGATPFVMSTAAPTYGTDTLAGGHFWWVSTVGGGNDAKGHNVLNLSLQDGNITAAEGAPGGVVGCSNSCHNTLAIAQTAVSSLGSGCEGCHTHVAHHKGGDTTPIVDEEDGWFRFCSSAHDGGTRGATGLEDDDWQYVTAVADHNEYLGIVANHEASGGFGIGNTMTAYCCGCHGNFHIQDDGDAFWIRHPSDAFLPGGTTEYAEYIVYDPVAPVARLSSFNWAGGPSGTVLPNGATDMVMCLSCHRAHGSPFDDMLRWDYAAETIAGGGGLSDGTGCFVCHTAKDE